MPVIERANATITVAGNGNQIMDARIIDSPQPAFDAWEYAYDVGYVKPFSNSTRGNVRYLTRSLGSHITSYKLNMLPSYGVYFKSQLLTAPHIIKPAVSSSWLVYTSSLEDVASERFNIRDRDRGINMDLMSYANLHQVKNDPRALLDKALLLTHSEKTFQTFFKHFAVSGKWYGSNIEPESAVFQQRQGAYSEDQWVNGTVIERIEILSMNETATWLSVAILIVLILILFALIASLQVIYPKDSMQHRVECLADVLAMIAGSDELLHMAHKMSIEEMEKSGVQTRLGWFRDKRGAVRWGVEVADEIVEWVDRRKI
jgi:hypothetical protein